MTYDGPASVPEQGSDACFFLPATEPGVTLIDIALVNVNDSNTRINSNIQVIIAFRFEI